MKRLPLLAGLVAAAVAAPLRPSAAPSRPLEIYFVDVEGGAATLTVLPSGESVLVDSGWPREDGRDAKRIEHVARYVAGLKQIDHYATTHWHTDHYGGIEQLAKLMPVRHYWDRGIPDSLSDDPKGFPTLIAAYRRASGGQSRALRPGDTLPLNGEGAEMEVLAASGKVIGEGDRELATSCSKHPGKPVDPSDNAKSLALRFRHGRFDFLNCGDLTWNIEHKLACPKNRVGKIDLWQVTHHGFDASNNPALVEAIQPRCAIVCNGPKKGGSPEVIRLLKRTKSLEAFYQLHLNVTSGADDNASPERIANLDENCKGDFLSVRLNEQGDRYTVYKNATQPLQTFAVR